MNQIIYSVTILLISGHFYNLGYMGYSCLSMMFLSLLFFSSKEVLRIRQVSILISLLILGSVAISTFNIYLIPAFLVFLTSLYLHYTKIKNHKSKNVENFSVTISFYLTFFLLLMVHFKTKFPMFLGTRFFKDYGLIQIFFHACYSSYLMHLFLTYPERREKLRLYIWTLFSFVFFFQFFVGILGVSEFLQTGKLHYPIPAMIIAGPVYRGDSFFMLILLLSTIVLVGPSWCSHLCYVGALDNLAANLKKTKSLKKKTLLLFSKLRWLTLCLAFLIPISLKAFSTSNLLLHGIIILFAITSIFFMFLSSKFGRMIHCTYFCPIGIVTNTLGKISPFRLKIGNNCDACMHCLTSCKYGALTPQGIRNHKVGPTCTFCLDCLGSCSKKSFKFTVFKNEKLGITIFYLLILSIHSISLAVARL